MTSFSKLKAAAEDFIAKVDRGEAKSVRSYAKFKEALDTTSSKTFVVGYIGWSYHELLLERIEALDWRIAVTKHSKFPWNEESPDEIARVVGQSEEDFKQSCFDCDCMMSWIEVTP